MFSCRGEEKGYLAWETKLLRLASSWSKYCLFIGFVKASKRAGSTISFPAFCVTSVREEGVDGWLMSPAILGVACRDDCGVEDVVVVSCLRNKVTGPFALWDTVLVEDDGMDLAGSSVNTKEGSCSGIEVVEVDVMSTSSLAVTDTSSCSYIKSAQFSL